MSLPHIHGTAHIAACGFACLILAACEANETQPHSSSSTSSIKDSAERGPVRLTVSADKGEISVGENLLLTIDVIADPGVSVTMPHVERQIGAFEVIDSQLPPDIPDAGKRRWTHQHTLRTLDAGEQQIPSITVKFIDARNAAADAAPAENEVATQPLTIQVRSLLAGEFNPEQFRDIKNEVAVPLPWDYRPWLYGAGAALLLGGAIAAIVLLRRARGDREAIAAPPPPPHIWALQQLDQLAAEHLIERGEHHEFFFRLSAIVRQYIERRFGIMAAEQTTDEFLREAQRNPSLNQTHRQLLGHFLRQADMVKFARFQPPQHESEAALAAARRFVHDTSPHAAPSPNPELAEVNA